MRTPDELRVTHHLMNEQDTTGPGQSPGQDVFFLTFGRTGYALGICICPLGEDTIKKIDYNLYFTMFIFFWFSVYCNL